MAEDNEMGFLDHLEELRWRLVRAIIGILVAATAIFIGKTYVFENIILAPKESTFITYRMLCKLSESITIIGDMLCFDDFDFILQNLTMAGQFTTHIMVSLIGGIIVAFPYVVYQIWSFIKPALQDKELKHAKGTVFYVSVLFISGVLFGYFLIAPLSVHFLGTYKVAEAVQNQISLNSFISTVTTTTLATGVVFQLPIAMYFLAKVGVVTAGALKKFRKHAIVALLILSAIITPPDVFSQLLVTGPLMLLYELSIVIAKRVNPETT